MTQKEDLLIKITEEIKKLHYNFDLSDVGNQIGFVIAKYYDDRLGFRREDFESGFDHGCSLVDGSHG